MALWGGRFEQSPALAAFALSRSIHFDWRLALYDLRSSRAHLAVLEKSGLIEKEVARQIQSALQELATEVSEGMFVPVDTDEDVHSALERGLIEKLGAIGGALRAGRSRNDQVATDLRLFAQDHLLEIARHLLLLQEALLKKSEEYATAPAPGFTHLQHAQPVLFGHELAKHAHALDRDIDRIHDWFERTSVSPLGSGALAGSSLPLDPEFTAQELGFASSARNSIDAVSDRDFVAEALFIMSMIGVHLSRMGEEWTLWASTEFSWANLADEYSTGSSIMPQKKNPDVAELARGKSGRLIGNLTSVLAMLKGLPFAYNRDLQEDKEPFFDSIDTLLLLLPALTGMVSTTDFDREAMESAAPAGFSLATEIADFLVRQRVPFSEAHEAAGKCVALCEKTSRELHQLTPEELFTIHPALSKDVLTVLTVEGALASRVTSGGTSEKSLRAQLAALRQTHLRRKGEITNAQRAFSGMMGA